MTCKNCLTKIRCFLGIKHCPTDVPVDTTPRLDVGRVTAALQERNKTITVTKSLVSRPEIMRNVASGIHPGYATRYIPPRHVETTVKEVSSSNPASDALMMATAIHLLSDNHGVGSTVWEAPASMPAPTNDYDSCRSNSYNYDSGSSYSSSSSDYSSSSSCDSSSSYSSSDSGSSYSSSD